MHEFPIIIFAALLTFGFGLFSRLSERSPITAPMVFVTVGLLVSPFGIEVLKADEGFHSSGRLIEKRSHSYLPDIFSAPKEPGSICLPFRRVLLQSLLKASGCVFMNSSMPADLSRMPRFMK